jgi:hypothetical protein
MTVAGCTPVSYPRLPPTAQHPMWQVRVRVWTRGVRLMVSGTWFALPCGEKRSCGMPRRMR